MRIMVISLLFFVLIATGYASEEEIDFSYPENIFAEEEFDVNIEFDTETIYDVKIYVYDDTKAYSEIMDGDWKSPYRFLNGAFPAETTFKIKSHYVGEADLCVILRETNQNNNRIEKCVLIEVLEKEAEEPEDEIEVENDDIKVEKSEYGEDKEAEEADSEDEKDDEDDKKSEEKKKDGVVDIKKKLNETIQYLEDTPIVLGLITNYSKKSETFSVEKMLDAEEIIYRILFASLIILILMVLVIFALSKYKGKSLKSV